MYFDLRNQHFHSDRFDGLTARHLPLFRLMSWLAFRRMNLPKDRRQQLSNPCRAEAIIASAIFRYFERRRPSFDRSSSLHSFAEAEHVSCQFAATFPQLNIPELGHQRMSRTLVFMGPKEPLRMPATTH